MRNMGDLERHESTKKKTNKWGRGHGGNTKPTFQKGGEAQRKKVKEESGGGSRILARHELAFGNKF